MQVSEKVLKWAMRLYPPFLFQRIWVRHFGKGFKSVTVGISRSLLNRNYNASIFGGTIFAAADPFYALMFDQIFRRKGFKTVVWLKSASIQYTKPARTRLIFSITIDDDELHEVEAALIGQGRFVKTYAIVIRDRTGDTCAIMQNEVYIKDVGFQAQKQASGSQNMTGQP